MSVTPKLGLPVIVAGESGAEAKFTQSMLVLEQFCFPTVLRRDDAPGGTEVDGDAIIVEGTPSAEFATFTEGQIAYMQNGGWLALTPPLGASVFSQQDQAYYHWIGSSPWIADSTVGGDLSVQGGFSLMSDDATVASSTQTQGQGQLTKTVSIIKTVAADNDTVTLPHPTLSRGVYWVLNKGTHILQVFPYTGNKIDNGSVNASITIAPGDSCQFFSAGSVYWTSPSGDITLI